MSLRHKTLGLLLLTRVVAGCQSSQSPRRRAVTAHLPDATASGAIRTG